MQKREGLSYIIYAMNAKMNEGEMLHTLNATRNRTKYANMMERQIAEMGAETEKTVGKQKVERKRTRLEVAVKENG